MKKLLLLNGSSSEIMLIEAAKRLGFYVITTGFNPELPGRKFADKYVEADYSNHQEILKLAQDLKIDAICANANDEGAMTAIYVAEQLGLPGVRDKYEVAQIFHQKDKFKEFVNKYNFLTPQSEMFTDEEEAIGYLDKIEYPIIIKPVDRSGGLGVSEASTKEEGISGIKYAFEMSKVKRIVVEEYLQGRQYDFHTFLIDKKLAYYSASNEYSFKNPYRVNCLTIPADHDDEITQILIKETERMAKLLDLADGVFWLQYKIKNGKPYLIESARRCGGNNMLDLLSRGFQIDFGELVLRLETGMEYRNYMKHPIQMKSQGYQSLSPAQNGVIKGVHIDEELRKHIFKEYYWYKEGEEVTNYKYSSYGIILFEYDTQEEMMQEVQRINEDAKIIVE